MMPIVQYLCDYYSNYCVFPPFLCLVKYTTFVLENLNVL